MPQERILLAVDLSYQTYRAAAAHPLLTCRRVFTGGLYGFVTSFAKAVRETRATDVVFCQDVRPYLRSLAYPDYKQIRKKSIDEDLLHAFKQSMSLVLEVLEAAGLPVWGIPGFESDDLIAHCAEKYRHRFRMIYAGSNDSDLFQLLRYPNFRIYRKSIADVMTGERLRKDEGVTPEQYMLMTALTGTHNDVAGIHGVGPAKARKAIDDPRAMRHWRAHYGELIDRNLGLIRLPHPQFPFRVEPPVVRDFRPRELYRALGRYDIDVTAAVADAFNQITRGNGQ